MARIGFIPATKGTYLREVEVLADEFGRPNTNWGIPVWQYLLEIVLLWIMYLAGMVLVYKKWNR